MYRIYCYSMGNFHPTEIVVKNKRRARKNCEWFNNLKNGCQYIYKKEK